MSKISIHHVDFPYLVKLPSVDKNSRLPEKALQQDYQLWINGTKIIIPSGFVTDLASVPRFFWRIFNPDDPRFTVASLVHDWLYALEIIERNEADRIFRAILAEASDVRKFEELAMFGAVYCFGGLTYRNHSEASVRELRTKIGITNMARPLYKTVDDLKKLWEDSEYYKKQVVRDESSANTQSIST